MIPRAPRDAVWLLRRCLPDDVLDAVMGDLTEVFCEKASSRGRKYARAWFRLQAVSFSGRFLAERLRESGARLSAGSLPSALDLKLGARMLVKSPLLTLTGCVAIATAIGINAGFNEFTRDMLSVVGEVDADERIVGIVHHDIETGQRDPRLIQDLDRWREDMETVQDVGAAIRLDMSLVGPGGHATPVDVVEMSASGFGITGMVPELGRPLLPSDDGPAAEPVLVLGHDAWHRHLDGAPDIVGSSVRLGTTTYRVVGVAPADFAFPRAPEMWVNFRRDPTTYPPRAGPPVMVFGRLAEGRSLAEARSEIERLGLRAAEEWPETHARLRPQVRPFGESFGLDSAQIRWGLRIARAFLVMLLVVACANIATLVFARNARRESEIAVRSALGAGRRRIAVQMFGEALVLAVLSTAVGLFAADGALRYGSRIFWEVQRTEPPHWWDPGMSASTVLYSLGLAVLGAAVVGIFPALRATGRRSRSTLQRVGAGSPAMSFGRLPTAVIVVQIAIAVALIPIVLTGTVSDFRDRLLTVSFSTDDYLTARLLVDSEVQLAASAADREAGLPEGRVVAIAGVTDRFHLGPSLLERYRRMRENIGERLRNEPSVRRVAFTTRLPGLLGQSIPATVLEVAGRGEGERGWRVQTATSELDMFDVIGGSMVAGRAFTSADYAPDQRVAIVNRTFVDEIFGGRSAVGHLVRDVRPDDDEARPWTEIVGVLPDEVVGPAAAEPRIYYPLSDADAYPLRMLVEVADDPADFAPRLRAIVADAEPGLILDEVLPLDELQRSEMLGELFFVVLLGFVALVTALLATAGVYALMSFIVSQRTREIGIRTALGAEPARVVRGVFARTFVQLGIGVVVGLVAVGVLGTGSPGVESGRTLWLAGAGVSAVLVTVGLIGCAIPVARALRIHPSEALSAEG